MQEDSCTLSSFNLKGAYNGFLNRILNIKVKIIQLQTELRHTGESIAEIHLKSEGVIH